MSSGDRAPKQHQCKVGTFMMCLPGHVQPISIDDTMENPQNNKTAMSILKHALKIKPDTMNSDQTEKNGTIPEAPLFNVFRVQYRGYPIGQLFSKLCCAGHGIEGNYGTGGGVHMYDANSAGIVPHHLVKEWRNFVKTIEKKN